MANILYLNQYFITTLNVGGGIDDSQTTGVYIADDSGIDTTKPGIALINYADPLNTSIAEWVEYSSLSSKEFQGLVRGQEGFSAKAHDNGVQVAFPLSESHINRIADKLTGEDSGVTLIDPVLDNDYQTATDGATVTFNLASGAYRKHKVVLGGNRTLAISNALVGQAFIIDLVQDATGSRTVTWFSTIKWAGGSAPTLTTDANAIDTFGFICTSSGNYQGYVIGQDVS